MTSEIGTSLPIGEFNERQLVMSALLRAGIEVTDKHHTFTPKALRALLYLHYRGANVEWVAQVVKREEEIFGLAGGIARLHASLRWRK